MRSDNLRVPPGFFTPDLVRRMLEQIDKRHVIDAAGMPVIRMPQPKPTLRIIAPETGAENQTEHKCFNPPVAHVRQAEESEAALEAPHAASPPRPKPIPICEVEKASARQTGAVSPAHPIQPRPAASPSREPAPPAPRSARAQPDCKIELLKFGDALERAKAILTPRHVPVCSMEHFGGDPGLFMVGSRKNLTPTDLIELAKRFEA